MFAVNKRSKNVSVAAKLVIFLSSLDAQLKRDARSNGIPVRKSALAQREALPTSPEAAAALQSMACTPTNTEIWLVRYVTALHPEWRDTFPFGIHISYWLSLRAQFPGVLDKKATPEDVVRGMDLWFDALTKPRPKK